MRYEKLIVDADICIKIGASSKYRYLEKLLPAIAKNLYMHIDVYSEVMSPISAKEQVDNLLESKQINLLDEKYLDELEKKAYESIYKSLADVMIDPRQKNKNAGEVASLAMAKTMSIQYFGTDEKNLQIIVDRILNIGKDDIRCIRIKDIVMMIKENQIEGFNRKDAKIIWRLSGKATAVFDNEIWPTSSNQG